MDNCDPEKLHCFCQVQRVENWFLLNSSLPLPSSVMNIVSHTLQISVPVCLMMGNVNSRLSLGQYLPLSISCSWRQTHLRQRALVLCRLNKFTSPVWASWSITGNSLLQPPIMRFKSTSIINLGFRCLCINKRCEIKTPNHNIWLSCIHHIFWVTFLNFLSKQNLKISIQLKCSSIIHYILPVSNFSAWVSLYFENHCHPGDNL